jgi:A/G-specific adenine glycosylase
LSKQDFNKRLLAWYDENKRSMPWRDCDDPYKTWVSEIMLQQTRVEQAIPYFHRFMERFPTVDELAAADQQEVLKIWEGLGYYSRARNMHHAAKTVVKTYDGNIPDTEKEIRALKGIGPYTAAAVLSIAYSKAYAVVDGNVLRVLTRYLGIEDDIRSQQTKNVIQDAADDLLDTERPGDFNQAMMELGATICTPSKPDCINCPISSECTAYATLKTDSIPYKSPAKKRPHHQIGVGIIKDDDQVLIALRPDDAMLGGLWEFPGGKQKEQETIEETVQRELKEELGVEVSIIKPFMKLDHAYSHFKITLHAYICELMHGTPSPKSSQEIEWVSLQDLDQYPFPKANRKLTRKLMNAKGQKELDL